MIQNHNADDYRIILLQMLPVSEQPRERLLQLWIRHNLRMYSITIISGSLELFLPNLATVIQPLLQKGKKWVWSSKCSQAMKSAKQLLTTSKVLTHYDTKLPLKLAADASHYG